MILTEQELNAVQEQGSRVLASIKLWFMLLPMYRVVENATAALS